MFNADEVKIVHCHAEGEVGDVVVSGVDTPPGDTLWQQARYIANDERLRNFLLNEPRGGVFRHVNLLVPPVNPEASAGFIIMEPADTPPMSGSNSLCVAKVVLETDIVDIQAPETELVLEAPGGLVRVIAHSSGGKVESLRVRNLPSFVDRLDATLNVERFGTLKVSTVYGGDSFVIVDSAQTGIEIMPTNARRLAQAGMAIVKAANEQIGFTHPDLDGFEHLSFCLFADPLQKSGDVLSTRQAVAIRPGKIDRSPTGTGLSARMALLYALGEMEVGDSLVTRSIIDSTFTGRIESPATVAGRAAINPSIEGRAFIYGTSRFLTNVGDPWPEGYRLNDTWPQ